MTLIDLNNFSYKTNDELTIITDYIDKNSVENNNEITVETDWCMEADLSLGFSNFNKKNNYKYVSCILDDKQNIICRSFPKNLDLDEFIKEYNVPSDQVAKYLELHAQDVSILEEGTFLRLYFYKNKWIISSLKCFDSAKTFIFNKEKKGINYSNIIFDNFNIDFAKLNSHYTYCFVLKSYLEPKIIKPKHFPHELVFLGICDNNDINNNFYMFNQVNKLPQAFENCENIFLSEKINILNFDELLKKINEESFSDNNLKGYSITLHDGNKISLVFEDYLKIQKIRGNTLDIELRFLELEENIEEQKILNDYFPEFNLYKIKETLEKCVHLILKLYKKIYIHKQKNYNIPFICKKLISCLHAKYINTRKYITEKDCNVLIHTELNNKEKLDLQNNYNNILNILKNTQ